MNSGDGESCEEVDLTVTQEGPLGKPLLMSLLRETMGGVLDPHRVSDQGQNFLSAICFSLHWSA